MGLLARLAGPALLLVGLGLVVLAVVRSEASLHLVLIVPVLAGSSPLFLLGVLLVVVGFALLPLALGSTSPEVRPPSGPGGIAPSPPPSEAFGGVILIGPVPLFFGAWRHPDRRRYLLAVALGTAVVVAAVLAIVLL